MWMDGLPKTKQKQKRNERKTKTKTKQKKNKNDTKEKQNKKQNETKNETKRKIRILPSGCADRTQSKKWASAFKDDRPENEGMSLKNSTSPSFKLLVVFTTTTEYI